MKRILKKNKTEFALGDFARMQTDGSLDIGIITEIDRLLVLEYPFNGYPFTFSMGGSPSSYIKVTRREALHCFQAHSRGLEKQVESVRKTKDCYLVLSTAIRAWEKYYLDLMIQKLERAESPLQRYEAMKTALPSPGTGVYVIKGYYLNKAGDTLYTFGEGLLTFPDLRERILQGLLMELAPEGFGNIPGTIKGIQGKPNSKYYLEEYIVHELPKYAIELVKERNPKRID